MGEWNAQESACWNRLRTALARSLGVLDYVGAVEVQSRGALHRHVVLMVPAGLSYEEVQTMVMRAGYGCVTDLQRLDSARQVSKYLSKYVTKSSGERPNVPWSRTTLDESTGELIESRRRASFRLWSSSHRWGLTMREVKSTAMLQARARERYLRELAEAVETSRSAAGPEAAAEPSLGPP